MRRLPPRRTPDLQRRTERVTAAIIKTLGTLDEDSREDVFIAIALAYCLYCGADKAKSCRCGPLRS